MQTFISLMESHEKNNDGIDFVPYKAPLQSLAQKDGVSIFFKNYPIKDRSITTVKNMRDVLDAIDHSLDRKIPVYVHCFGGIGRTGMVICCWLLRHGYANSEDVFDLLSQLRKPDLERATWPAPVMTGARPLKKLPYYPQRPSRIGSQASLDSQNAQQMKSEHNTNGKLSWFADDLKKAVSQVHIGVRWNTQVTLPGGQPSGHTGLLFGFTIRLQHP